MDELRLQATSIGFSESQIGQLRDACEEQAAVRALPWALIMSLVIAFLKSLLKEKGLTALPAGFDLARLIKDIQGMLPYALDLWAMFSGNETPIPNP